MTIHGEKMLIQNIKNPIVDDTFLWRDNYYNNMDPVIKYNVHPYDSSTHYNIIKGLDYLSSKNFDRIKSEIEKQHNSSGSPLEVYWYSGQIEHRSDVVTKIISIANELKLDIIDSLIISSELYLLNIIDIIDIIAYILNGVVIRLSTLSTNFTLDGAKVSLVNVEDVY